jgi:mRNA-degrading endonuclease RelE of RelBE toxin-antitoxin system
VATVKKTSPEAPKKPRKASPRKPAAVKKAAARPLPDPAGDAPLHELSRDALSVLLYVALLPEETRALVKDLGVSVPGFRTEALSDVERCDVVADEIRASPAARGRVIDHLRRAFGRPPLVSIPADAIVADDVLAIGASDHGLTLALWRVLADPDPAVRARAVPVLEQLVAEYYAPAPAHAGGRAAAPPGEGDGAAAAARVKELEKELARAEERIASARKKADEGREKLQEWLKEARARAAQAVDEAARARELADAASRARDRAEAALAAAQATDAAAEAQRARAALKDAEGRAAALDARLARLQQREAELEAALRDARAAPDATPERALPAASGEGDEPEDAPASWLMPVYTREFYDSLEGWDRRVQRAAFKQAHLLAQDHRHPSLRALPLEGLPGYYRVRVATDVRLLYRRGDRQNTIEILSLIDREDLDRYVRQAKTRQ